MGVLPLVFKDGESFDSFNLQGDETFEIENLNSIRPNSLLTVKAIKDGKETRFQVIVKLNTEIEINYIKTGGILHYVLRQMIKA